MEKVITKQMVRDLVVFNTPISVSSLAYKIFKDEITSPKNYNTVMVYVSQLENEGVLKFNAKTGCYETDLKLR